MQSVLVASCEPLKIPGSNQGRTAHQDLLAMRKRAPLRWWPETSSPFEEEHVMSDVPKHILREAASRDFKPSVRVGKAGLSETVVDEIMQQFNSRNLVKVKVNKGLYEREQRSEVWAYLATSTGSILVLQRGNIGVLWRR